MNLSIDEAIKFLEKYKNNEKFLLIDIRTRGEYNEYHLENSLNYDYYDYEEREKMLSLDKDNIYLIYCAHGIRSNNMLILMEEAGFTTVAHITYGLQEWVDQDQPVVK